MPAGSPVSLLLIGLMIIMYLVGQFTPILSLLEMNQVAGWILSLILSCLLPGSLLGAIFLGIFIWIIGSQVEPLDTAWKYLLVFFGGGAVGTAIIGLIEGAPVLTSSFAGYALAGALTYVMTRHRFTMGGAWSWALTLLVLNAVLGGFNTVLLGGMIGAFGGGYLLASLARYGER